MKLPVRYSLLSPTEKRRVREEYISRQGGVCMHCHENIYDPPPDRIMSKTLRMSLFPKGFLQYPIHLQHNHTTDLTEGAVHAYCNGVLWQYHGR